MTVLDANGKVYNAFEKATRATRMEAHYIYQGARQVGRVIFQRSASGATETCWLHLWGTSMVQGSARGYGYDKQGAAYRDALSKLKVDVKYDDAPVGQAVKALKACTDEGARFAALINQAGYQAQHVI